MVFTVSESAVEAIVAELSSRAPEWRREYFRKRSGKRLNISFSFREPVPAGADKFLAALSHHLSGDPDVRFSRNHASLVVSDSTAADILVWFWRKPAVRLDVYSTAANDP